MNTKEAFDRMAKCGVDIPLVSHDQHGFYRVHPDGRMTVPEDHVDLILEAAWHRKWPHHTVTQDIGGGWFVWDSQNESIVTEEDQSTRLEAWFWPQSRQQRRTAPMASKKGGKRPRKMTLMHFYMQWHPDTGTWGLLSAVRGSIEGAEELSRELLKRKVVCYPVKVNITIDPVVTPAKKPAKKGRNK